MNSNYRYRENISAAIQRYAADNEAAAVAFVSELVRIESVNHPPHGNEAAYQRYIADWMRSRGAETEVYALADVPGLATHEAYMDTRDYTDRPNVIGRFFGHGRVGGRSLLFSGHADTVYEGTEAWTFPPFSGTVDAGRLYGRGAYDMKGGMAAAMMAVRCLQELGVPIAGDVYVESVVDEEYGGANGTLAGRLRGPNPDMAIIPEPSNLKLYPAHLGGGVWQASFSGKSGIGFAGEELVSALEATVEFANVLHAYNRYRKHRLATPSWWRDGRKAEVSLLGIYSGDHTRELQEKLPATGQVNFWIEGYPGMTGEEIVADLLAFTETQLPFHSALCKCRPHIRPLIRYLSASEMPAGEATELFLQLTQTSGERVFGQGGVEPPTGSPFACDGFMINLYSPTPALILGPAGGNAHAADEYLDIASYLALFRWYAELIVDWCGIEDSRVTT
ncbi:MAG: M20/M25/M40 family metallo-hydrolase [Paenibacillaceae bacterium]|nr:M20/M25/M40 family metallo-hydrolase [Paenibacillaceae bacterium]